MGLEGVTEASESAAADADSMKGDSDAASCDVFYGSRGSDKSV